MYKKLASYEQIRTETSFRAMKYTSHRLRSFWLRTVVSYFRRETMRREAEKEEKTRARSDVRTPTSNWKA